MNKLEDYKAYYEDATREDILEDTYIDYCSYKNLTHRYSKLKHQLEEERNKVEKAIEYLKDRNEDNMCCSVCSVMSDKLLEILGEDENETNNNTI